MKKVVWNVSNGALLCVGFSSCPASRLLDVVDGVGRPLRLLVEADEHARQLGNNTILLQVPARTPRANERHRLLYQFSEHRQVDFLHGSSATFMQISNQYNILSNWISQRMCFSQTYTSFAANLLVVIQYQALFSKNVSVGALIISWTVAWRLRSMPLDHLKNLYS